MSNYFPLIAFIISFNLSAQFKADCIYIDPNIVVIDCGVEDRYKISEAVAKLHALNAKVIVLDFIFFDVRAGDSIFIQKITGNIPIILSMGNKNDSSYFNIKNCYSGPRSIIGNKPKNVEYLFPIVTHNDKIRETFELLVLKSFDFEKYMKLKRYLTQFDLTKLNAKAKIEFNGNSLSCFNTINITELNYLNEEFIEGKIVILGYFGNNPDIPLDKDKDKYAFKVRSTKNKKVHYMYTTLISTNIISNIIRKDIRERESDLNKIGQ